jgi:hypothetical protein
MWTAGPRYTQTSDMLPPRQQDIAIDLRAKAHPSSSRLRSKYLKSQPDLALFGTNAGDVILGAAKYNILHYGWRKCPNDNLSMPPKGRKRIIIRPMLPMLSLPVTIICVGFRASISK